MTTPRFRALVHTADLRLAVWGGSEEELIAHGVAGACAAALGRLPRRAVRRWVTIEPWPNGLERRLVHAVNEALFRLFVRRELPLGFRLAGKKAELGVCQLPASRVPAIEIKAATFHALRVERQRGRLRAILTLDL